MAVPGLQDRCQLPRVLSRIVDSVHQAVLKCHPASCLFKVRVTCREHLGQFVFIRHGHKPPALLLGRAVQGERERDLEFFLRQLQHFRDNAAGGHCDIPLADVQAVLICQHPHEPEEIVIIVQRLPGAHDDHIVHPLFCDLLDLVDLPQHL